MGNDAKIPPVVWHSLAGSKYAGLGGLQGVGDEYEIKRGISRVKNFPKDAHFEMDKRFPRQINLADSIVNLDRMIVASTPLKEFIEAKRPRAVEFLPVSIYNHKGRVASGDYFVISPIEVVDCIDKSQSRFKWNAIDPTIMSSCSKLALDLDVIDPELLLFRPKHLASFVLTSAALAAEISAKGFTGVHFLRTDEFRV